MISKIKQLFDSSARKISTTDKDLEQIKSFEEELKEKSYKQMQDRVKEMQDELNKLVEKVPEESKRSLVKVNRRDKFPKYEKEIQDKLLEFMPEFYAMMNEVYRRESGYAYHDVQLRAAILLAKGQLLAELYTGEGKTRTFQLPLSLYSLVGRGAHLVTVNDYLTKIGGEYAGHFLSKLGLTVGIVTPEGSFKYISDDEIEKYKGEEGVKQRKEISINIDNMKGINLIQCPKREAYRCDVTYGTNNEFGFDYLRDNMAWELGRMSQRELYFCIIDEADSILIDEARTPLIISATPTDADTDKYSRFASAVKNLVEDEDFEVDHKSRSVNLTESGMNKVEKNLGVDNIWDNFGMAHHLENALKAKSLFIKNDQYIIKNGQIFIVDEFTGRVLEGRRYSEGLHQAIEAKEGVDIKQESRTFATITFQNFFRLYKILCGGSGTIVTENEEFFKIYGLDSLKIPTNKPNIRKDLPDRIYKTQESKFNAVVEEIAEMHDLGRPVLVGTTSVEKSEYLSNLLDKAGIHHEVLNAKFHEQESRIVAQAGKKGSVTVATNMAGRGTDIVIGGGVRGDENYEEIKELGGLHVIGTERHDSRRIDNQLRGRTGRQGEPGSTRFYSSLDDQIMRVLGGEFLSKMLGMIRVPDNTPIEMGFISKQIEVAQKRVENVNFDSRKSVVEYDDVMNQHREIFYTRRRNILSTAENALGRFDTMEGLIDLNLPENKKQAKDFEERIEDKKEKMEELIEDIVLDKLEAITYAVFPDVNINSEHVENFLKNTKDLIPSIYLTQVIDEKGKDLKEKLVKVANKQKNFKEYLLDKIEEAYEIKASELGDDFYNVTKAVTLESMDKKWVDHLEVMKDVRNSIRLEGYAQKNPIVEYKNKAYQIFNSFINDINTDFVNKFFRLTKTVTAQQPSQELETNEDEVEDVLTGTREMIVGDEGSIDTRNAVNDIEKAVKRQQSGLRSGSGSNRKSQFKNDLKNIGRNDKVTVKYKNGDVKKNVKFKKVERDIETGKAEIV